MGVFSIEPLKSSKNKFNLWYVDEQINYSINNITDGVGDLCNFPYEYDVLYVNKLFFKEDRSNESSATRSNATLLHLGTNKLNSRAGISRNFMPSTGYQPIVIVHETGHALFGLRDEYKESGQEKPRYGNPNCIENLEEAKKLWGDLEGQYDNFVDQVNEENKKHSLSLLDKDNYTVGYFYGGCGVGNKSKLVVRPTKQSLMNNDVNHPIFGPVNRRYIETILNVFTGDLIENNKLLLPNVELYNSNLNVFRYILKNFGYATHFIIEYKEHGENYDWNIRKFKTEERMMISIGYKDSDILFDKHKSYIVRIKIIDENGNFKDSNYSEEVIFEKKEFEYGWNIYSYSGKFSLYISPENRHEEFPKEIKDSNMFLIAKNGNGEIVKTIGINNNDLDRNDPRLISDKIDIDEEVFFEGEEYNFSLCVGKSIDNCKKHREEKKVIAKIKKPVISDDE